MDKENNIQFLIDTGADISILPKSTRRALKTDTYKLDAANGTVINTYGNKILTINLGLRRPVTWRFVVADVAKAIIGADFLHHYNLLVDLRRRQIIDSNTNLFKIGAIIDSALPTISTINIKDRYQALLKEFTNITKPQHQVSRNHNVYHHIITKGPPVTDKPRRLTLEKLAVTKTEFQQMLTEGIIQPSKSQ
ncbi:uncharacterized protein LOC128893700 [Hylaeus anthracinus]|uniref:uncharacterized protein LOC128893700 n=1 Tax=Hylaeus anthracinus TaxID=313031 RepID=UPI0023B8D273|nr:uncharacterized protein LOC128893700 [Hylaeus anthracinus]